MGWRQYLLLRAVVRIQQNGCGKLSTPQARGKHPLEGSWHHFLTSLGQKVSPGPALEASADWKGGSWGGEGTGVS